MTAPVVQAKLDQLLTHVVASEDGSSSNRHVEAVKVHYLGSLRIGDGPQVMKVILREMAMGSEMKLYEIQYAIDYRGGAIIDIEALKTPDWAE